MVYFGCEHQVSKFGDIDLFIIIITILTAPRENPAILKEDVLHMEVNPNNLQVAIKYTSQQLCNPASLSAMLAQQGCYPVQQCKGTLCLSSEIDAKFNLMEIVPVDPLGLLIPLPPVPTMMRLQPKAN